MKEAKSKLITFEPYPNEKEDPLSSFRSFCREVFPRATADQPVPLHHITAVGALVDEDGKLSFSDELYLEEALHQCVINDISVDPDFKLTIVNHFYADDQDFLAPEFYLPTDLLLVCFVCKPIYYCSYLFEKNVSWGVSPYQQKSNAWPLAANRSGASVVVIAGGKGEITRDDFLSDDKRKDLFVDISGSNDNLKGWDCYYPIHCLVSRPFGEARHLIEPLPPEPAKEKTTPSAPVRAPECITRAAQRFVIHLIQKGMDRS